MSRTGGIARSRHAVATRFHRKLVAIAAAACLCAGPAASGAAQTVDVASAEPAAQSAAQSAAQTAPPSGPSNELRRGGVTGLPVPRFVSLKSDTVNVRRGPSLSHRVDWVFVRRGLPVEVIAEHGNWRKIRDHDGASGWVHHTLIRGARSVIVVAPEAMLMDKPSAKARPVARAERGVLASIEECGRDWCDIEAEGYEGWALKSALWGVGADEVFD